MALAILKKLSFIDLSGNDVSNDIVNYIIEKEFTCEVCGDKGITFYGFCRFCSDVYHNPNSIRTRDCRNGWDHRRYKKFRKHDYLKKYQFNVSLRLGFRNYSGYEIDTYDLGRWLRVKIDRTDEECDGSDIEYKVVLQVSNYLNMVLDYSAMIGSFFRTRLEELDIEVRGVYVRPIRSS